MVLRKNVICISKNCNKKYIVRYSVGDKFPQWASFFCADCGTKLEFGIDKNRSITLRNLEFSSAEEFSGTIQNLHPEIVFDKDMANSDYFFASMPFLIQKKLPDIIKLRKIQHSILNYNSQWDQGSNDFRLLREDRYELLKKSYSFNNDVIKQIILKKVTSTMHLFIEGVWKNLYTDLKDEIESLKTNPGFIELKHYLTEKFNDFFIRRGYQIMSDYSQLREELQVTLIQQKSGDAIEGTSSSVAWDKIEMFYGSVYEAYGDLLVIPSALNNLKQRGNHTLFQTLEFTLSKYESTDKAGRCENFKGNSRLHAFGHFYLASLRNGTYHKTATIDQVGQQIIMKTGRSGATKTEISFTNYIVHCNEIYARCLLLLLGLYDITEPIK